MARWRANITNIEVVVWSESGSIGTVSLDFDHKQLPPGVTIGATQRIRIADESEEVGIEMEGVLGVADPVEIADPDGGPPQEGLRLRFDDVRIASDRATVPGLPFRDLAVRIMALRCDLNRAEEELLAAHGWEKTSDTPDWSYMWRKEHSGQTIMVDMRRALQLADAGLYQD